MLRLAIICLFSILPVASVAQERVALVVGMASYEHIVTLDNTANDARGISETLRAIGFEVQTLIDTPHSELVDALDRFSFRAETADLALIYFAGHGVEVSGENFLVPVDARVQTNRDIQRQSVSLKDFLSAVDGARQMRIVILDSCRDNPFGGAIDLEEAPEQVASSGAGTRGGRGLAPPAPDRGTLVAFAARDGQVALDGTGSNSPFAEALISRLAEPGLEISLMFRQVRDMVLAATGNLQEPHTYGSLPGAPFFIAGPKEGKAPPNFGARAQAWAEIGPEQETALAALADAGDTRSLLGLAYIRLNPEGDRFDPDRAAALLERAAAAGDAEAQFELAKLYENGLGVPKNPARALELYRLSAAQDFPDAINDLGFLHYEGALGLEPDAATALIHFGRAADLRHPQAMYNYAALIDDGLIPGKGPEDSAAYLYQALRTGAADVFDILRERPAMFKLATRKALQERLRENGFYTGAIDGDFGPGTQGAIRVAFGLKD